MKCLLLTLALLVSPAGDPFVLENDFVRVVVDGRTGAVTSMTCKKAATFPLIAERGAGVAGRGEFFGLPDLTDVRVQGRRLTGRVKRLAVERTFRQEPGESGFRMVDTFTNPGGEPASLRLGHRSRLQAEPWRLVVRSWYGDGEWRDWKQMPGNAGTNRQELKTPRLYWRVIGPYGVGFLAAVTHSRAPATLTHALGRDGAIDCAWESAELSIPAGGSASVECAVLIDEGGREGATGPSRTAVTIDLRRCGLAGEAIPASATLVSAEARRVRCRAFQRYDGAERTLVKEGEVALEPGRGTIVPIDVVPDRKGTLHLDVELSDEKGAALASSSARCLVDGEGPEWNLFSRKIPSRVYRGTWAEIGAQLAKEGRLKRRSPDGKAAERQAFYEKRFPFYAELVKGAASALGARPEELVSAAPEGPSEACMDVFFNGPDGPINAFSKERTGTGLGGLAYMKVLPDRGYAYHVYECGSWQNGYGVNSEGLATSGATINCDNATTAAGRKGLQQWKSGGKLVAPLGSHMLLANCKNVEEAIAFIEDPNAPFEFEGNKLFVDRAGNAARLESVGIKRQIIRYDPKNPGNGFFVAGNYSNEAKDGTFKVGPEWGWAANTMLRERHIWDLAGGKREVSLKDAFRIMESHAAGGMCQHISDNVGKLYSSNSYIAVCRTSELWLSHGSPCQFRYYKFSLKE